MGKYTGFSRDGLDLSIQAEPLTQEICCAVANNDRCSLPNAPVCLLLTVDRQIHRLFGIRLGFVNPSRAVDPRNLLRCSEQRSLFLTKRSRLLTAHCRWANTQTFRLWLGFVNPSRAANSSNLLGCSEHRSLFLTKRAHLLTAHCGWANTQTFAGMTWIWQSKQSVL